MSSIFKLGLGAVLALGVFVVWKAIDTPDAAAPAEKGAAIDITERDWIKGNPEAPVTLVEYTDFQCPACAAYYPILEQLAKEMGDQVKIVIRHYPLIQIHKNALPAARAAEAAGRQGKFWEMYDLLYQNQAEWSNADDPTKSIFAAYAGRAGMDADRFREDMGDSALDDKINEDRGTGNELKITGTPSFFLNGKKLENPRSLEEFKKAVEKALP